MNADSQADIEYDPGLAHDPKCIHYIFRMWQNASCPFKWVSLRVKCDFKGLNRCYTGWKVWQIPPLPYDSDDRTSTGSHGINYVSYWLAYDYWIAKQSRAIADSFDHDPEWSWPSDSLLLRFNAILRSWINTKISRWSKLEYKWQIHTLILICFVPIVQLLAQSPKILTLPHDLVGYFIHWLIWKRKSNPTTRLACIE